MNMQWDIRKIHMPIILLETKATTFVVYSIEK